MWKEAAVPQDFKGALIRSPTLKSSISAICPASKHYSEFRWTGHVIRMNDDRLPKVIFCSEFKDGTHSRGGQRKRYKDPLKANMKRCDMLPNNLEALALNGTG